MKRDAEKDLELCEKVTPGPGHVSEEGYVVQTDHVTRDIWYISHKDDDLNFVTESREALPYWINRTIENEKRLAETKRLLAEAVKFMRDNRSEKELQMKIWIENFLDEEFSGGD